MQPPGAPNTPLTLTIMSEDAIAINREHPAPKEWRISAVGATEIAQTGAGVMSRDLGAEDELELDLRQRKMDLQESQREDQVAKFLCRTSTCVKCDGLCLGRSGLASKLVWNSGFSWKSISTSSTSCTPG